MIRKLMAVLALTALCVAPVMADRLKDLAEVMVTALNGTD